jgi:carboxymethylenebutenolidase
MNARRAAREFFLFFCRATVTIRAMDRKRASDFDQELLNLYDDYAHGRLDRRGFVEKASRFAAGGISAAALLEILSPNYALADQVAADDPRITGSTVEYDSPRGAGRMSGYLVKPAGAAGRLPAVLVVHENRGLNPYIADVARRLALAGFAAFAPDALFPLGGYPGNDDEGRAMQAKRDPEQMLEDFAAAASWLAAHPEGNGQVGVVGFCYGGGVVHTLTVRMPEVIQAGVSFYGRQPPPADAAKVRSALLVHLAGQDPRVNEGWPPYQAALEQAGAKFTVHHYPGANHGFHNDTTPRFDEEAAGLAWDRTIAFFNENLKRG